MTLEDRGVTSLDLQVEKLLFLLSGGYREQKAGGVAGLDTRLYHLTPCAGRTLVNNMMHLQSCRLSINNF